MHGQSLQDRARQNSVFKRSFFIGSHFPLDGQQLGILGPTRIRHHRLKGRACTKPAAPLSLCIACTTRKVRPKPESPGNNASPVEPTLELPTSRQAWEARIQPEFVYQHWKGERQERPQNSQTMSNTVLYYHAKHKSILAVTCHPNRNQNSIFNATIPCPRTAPTEHGTITKHNLQRINARPYPQKKDVASIAFKAY